jgi:hypothetical protein
MANRLGMGLMLTAALSVLAASSAPAKAQGKELSDRSVSVLMEYAWAILPSIFRHPNGRVIEVDKKNKKAEVLIPVDTAREVIKVGYLSAQAQLCDMLEEQAQNYDAMMAREIVKKKWSEQQLLYISTLHRMTIHMAAGKLRVVEKGPDEIQVFQEAIEPSKETCPDDKRTRVKDAIAAYAASAPTVPRVTVSPPLPTGSTPPVQPAAAKEKPAAKEKK